MKSENWKRRDIFKWGLGLGFSIPMTQKLFSVGSKDNNFFEIERTSQPIINYRTSNIRNITLWHQDIILSSPLGMLFGPVAIGSLNPKTPPQLPKLLSAWGKIRAAVKTPDGSLWVFVGRHLDAMMGIGARVIRILPNSTRLEVILPPQLNREEQFLYLAASESSVVLLGEKYISHYIEGEWEKISWKAPELFRGHGTNIGTSIVALGEQLLVARTFHEKQKCFFSVIESISLTSGERYPVYQPRAPLPAECDGYQHWSFAGLVKDRDVIWIVGQYGKLFQWDGEQARLIEDRNRQSFSPVSAATIDRNHQLWLTGTDQIFCYPDGQVEELDKVIRPSGIKILSDNRVILGYFLAQKKEDNMLTDPWTGYYYIATRQPSGRWITERFATDDRDHGILWHDEQN